MQINYYIAINFCVRVNDEKNGATDIVFTISAALAYFRNFFGK